MLGVRSVRVAVTLGLTWVSLLAAMASGLAQTMNSERHEFRVVTVAEGL